MAEASEAALLDGLRKRDEAAFEELVRRHGGRMLVVARRLLGSEEDARDAVQEAFLSAFRGIDRFQGGALLSTWLHRIVVNASLMRLRQRRRRPETPIDELLPRFLDDGHHASPPLAWRVPAPDALEREEVQRLVRAGIQELPEGHRSVLVLRDVEGLDTAETARLLGLSPGAVKTRLHRARQALRTILDPHLREAERA